MPKYLDVKKKVIDTYIKNKEALEEAKKLVGNADIDKSIDAEAKVELYKDTLRTEYKGLVNLFRVICSHLTKDEFKVLEEKFIEMGDEEKLNRIKSNVVLTNKKYKGMKPEELDLSMIYTNLSSGYFRDDIINYIGLVTNFVGQERCDELAEEILSYDPVEENYVHDFEQDINKSKTQLSVSDLSREDKKKFSDILDEINELEYVSKPQSDELETNLASLNVKRIRTHVNNYVKNNDKLSQYIEPQDKGEALYKDSLIGNEEAIKSLDRHSIEFDREYKKNLIDVYNKMDSLGLLDSEFIFEQGTKVYGFRHYLDARNNLRKIINNNDFTHLEQARDEYVKQYNNIREIYAFIKEKINPDLLSYPANMSNFREKYVPKEFSKDLALNSTFNGFYYVFSSLKAADLDIKEFIDSPIIGSKKIVEKLYSDDYVDNVFTNVSREEKIMRLYSLKNYVTVRGTFRFVENFICHDPKPKDKNLLNYSLFVGNDDAITGASREYGDFYFNDEDTSDMQMFNMILTHNDNLAFSQLYCKDFKSRDALHIIKGFDTKKYVSEHEIDVHDLVTYSKNLLKEITKVRVSGLIGLNGQKLDRDYDYNMIISSYFKDIAQGLMKLADYKDLSIKEFDEINSLVMNPKEELKDLGFTAEELNAVAGAIILPRLLEDFRSKQKFYSALDNFNRKYGFNLDKKLFTDNLSKIDFDQNKFYKEEFSKLFNQMYNNSLDENKEFKDNAFVLNSSSLSNLMTEFNDICATAINDLSNEESKSPLETMSEQEKITMIEDAFGMNRILDVKYDGVSYKEKNEVGFKNLDYTEKAKEFLNAYQTITEGIVKFENNKEYTNDSKKVFLQSYREVFKTMNTIHNTNWFVKMIIHPKDYRAEKKMLNDTVNLVSKKLKMESLVVKTYLSKETDTLYSGSQSEYINNKDNVKSYSYDTALLVSDTITKTVDSINTKYHLENDNVDIVMRSKAVNNQRKNIAEVKLDDKVIDNKVEDIDNNDVIKTNELK